VGLSEEQAAFVAGWDRFMKELGIRGKAIGAKKLRERLLEEGFALQDNAFSRRNLVCHLFED
jgi:hypothetical protein